MKRLIHIGMVVVAAASLLFVMNIQPAAAAAPYYTFHMYHQIGGLDYCLDARSQDYGQGGTVQLWQCNGKDTQKWYPVSQNGWSEYMNGQSYGSSTHYCIRFRYIPINNGDTVQMWTCNGTSNEGWLIGDDGSPYMLPERNGNFPIDAKACCLGNGDVIQLWTFNGQEQQQFTSTYHA